MTAEDISALRAALDAGPTPGPWFKRGTLGPPSNESLKGPMVIERANGSSLAHMTGWRTDQQQADAAYIAAASPDRIARLLDALEEATRDAERYRWLRSAQRVRQGAAVGAGGSRSIPRDQLRGLMEFAFWCDAPELDAAIDAAIASTHALRESGKS